MRYICLKFAFCAADLRNTAKWIKKLPLKTQRELINGLRLAVHGLLCSNLDAGAHGRSGYAASDVGALCGCGLCLDDGVDQCIVVLEQLFGAEGDLADGAVDDVGLIQTILHLTGLDLLNGLGHVGGDGAGAEQLLDAAGVRYTLRLAEENRDAVRALGIRQAPTLVSGGQKWTGVSGVRAFLAARENANV